ncbi:uncharacterized protein LOC129984064 [Argiope bruennichi]|uniref:uncharacterized protein LOC129984064 n=1 Tax=Argiope bruennichi TaxID=94029 RepID=UPI002494F211|nr:uncharacterized protein LOC129984064 [Argiope bruennichi]
MATSVVLLVSSVLLIVRATLGEIDCENSPFVHCEVPKSFKELLQDISEFRVHCSETKSYLRCAKEYQDKCGTTRIELFRSEDLFEATYNAISEVCEEGTLLNIVAIENLKCFNDTFSKTECRKEAAEFSEPLIERLNEDPEFEHQNTLDIFCLEETLSTSCVLRALSENCGKLVEEATLEFIRLSKSLEYACSVEGTKSVLEQLDSLDLNEEKKKSVIQLLQKLLE